MLEFQFPTGIKKNIKTFAGRMTILSFHLLANEIASDLMGLVPLRPPPPQLPFLIVLNPSM